MKSSQPRRRQRTKPRVTMSLLHSSKSEDHTSAGDDEIPSCIFANTDTTACVTPETKAVPNHQHTASPEEIDPCRLQPRVLDFSYSGSGSEASVRREETEGQGGKVLKKQTTASAVNINQEHGCDDNASAAASTTSTNNSIHSIREDHGIFGNQLVPWKGCVCGTVHERPTKVFWIQCEGPCQAWYNVASQCVGGVTLEQAEQDDGLVWNCRSCQAAWQGLPPVLHYLLQELSGDVLYKILEFTAEPLQRAHVLCHSIAPLNRATRHFVQGEKSQGVWECILQREYLKPQQDLKQPSTKSSRSGDKKRKKPIINKEDMTQSARRASKRQRQPTNFLSPSSHLTSSRGAMVHQTRARSMVEEEHLALVGRTEEAFYILEELADPSNGNKRASYKARRSKGQKVRTLTLKLLQQLLQQHAPLDLNLRSPCTGRTMLQIVCAGEMPEGVCVACLQHLLKLGANPNLYSTQETPPLANKPALYFAIARTMPNLVSTLIQAGAQLDAVVTGAIRLTFDPSQNVEGTFTPLEYAQTMKRVEVVEAKAGLVPPYWVSRLNAVVRVLETAVGSLHSDGGACNQQTKLQ